MEYYKVVRTIGNKRLSFIIDPANTFAKEYSTNFTTERNIFIIGTNLPRYRIVSLYKQRFKALASVWQVPNYELWSVEIDGKFKKAKNVKLPSVQTIIWHPDATDYSALLEYNMNTTLYGQYDNIHQFDSSYVGPWGYLSRHGYSDYYIVTSVKLSELIATFKDNELDKNFSTMDTMIKTCGDIL